MDPALCLNRHARTRDKTIARAPGKKACNLIAKSTDCDWDHENQSDSASSLEAEGCSVRRMSFLHGEDSCRCSTMFVSVNSAQVRTTQALPALRSELA